MSVQPDECVVQKMGTCLTSHGKHGARSTVCGVLCAGVPVRTRSAKARIRIATAATGGVFGSRFRDRVREEVLSLEAVAEPLKVLLGTP